MKSTGITRAIDELGRFVVPKELRRSFDLNEKDQLEIYTEGDRIILQKYQPCCVFCSNADRVVYFNNKRICEDCLEKIKTQL